MPTKRRIEEKDFGIQERQSSGVKGIEEDADFHV